VKKRKRRGAWSSACQRKREGVEGEPVISYREKEGALRAGARRAPVGGSGKKDFGFPHFLPRESKKKRGRIVPQPVATSGWYGLED